MPRANRHSLPNHIWHIAHRCHKKEFLLKFARDRRRRLSKTPNSPCLTRCTHRCALKP